MGNLLIALVLPEESLIGSPRRRARASSDSPFPVEFEVRDGVVRVMNEDVALIVDIPVSAIWRPPDEPRETANDSKTYAKHGRAVRRSLEAFLNDRLGELDEMVRSGHWMLRRARVEVTTLAAVPRERTTPSEQRVGRRPRIRCARKAEDASG